MAEVIKKQKEAEEVAAKSSPFIDGKAKVINKAKIPINLANGTIQPEQEGYATIAEYSNFHKKLELV